ncbi:MAG: hypothetical protein HY599_01530 [Candidatus Omnitrophica bacterium]|nr:hypothetical protein [Candidatus Omnitrophota bacterium]
MKRSMAVRHGLAVLTAAGLFAAPVMAVDIPGPSVAVSANVSSTLTFSTTITELIPDGSGGTTIGPVVQTMDFGSLASNGTFDPDGPGGVAPQPRALNSLRAYQVFFGINAQQRPFSIKHTAGPLQSGGNTIPNGAFIVTPLSGIGGDPTPGDGGGSLPANITPGTRQSAVGTNIVLFSSSGGPSATMAATYGVTDDPNLGATAAIPLDQPTGNYVTTVVFTATII